MLLRNLHSYWRLAYEHYDWFKILERETGDAKGIPGGENFSIEVWNLGSKATMPGF